MRKTDTATTMQAEIRKRLRSDRWDIEIAERVLRRRKKTRGIRIFGTAAATAAASVVLAFFLNSGAGDRSTDPNLHVFIGTQVEGTYRQVFKQVPKEATSSDVSLIYASTDAVDDIITTSLAER